MIFDNEPSLKVYVGPRCSPSFMLKSTLIAFNFAVSAFITAILVAFCVGFETRASRVSFVMNSTHQQLSNYSYIDSTNIRLTNPNGGLLSIPVRYHSKMFGFTSDFVYFDYQTAYDQILEISARSVFPYRCNLTYSGDCSVFVSNVTLNSTMVDVYPTIHIVSGQGSFLITEYSIVAAAVLTAFLFITCCVGFGKVLDTLIETCFYQDKRIRVYHGAGFYRGLF